MKVNGLTPRPIIICLVSFSALKVSPHPACNSFNYNYNSPIKSLPLLDLDLNVSPSGKILKKVGESLEVKIDKNSSSEATVSWIKVRVP